MQKPVPMTFAGGPTYMPDYLKDAMKEKLFQGTCCTIKITPISMSTPILKNLQLL